MKNVYMWVGVASAILSCIFVARTVVSRPHRHLTGKVQRSARAEEAAAPGEQKRPSVSAPSLIPEAAYQPPPSPAPAEDESNAMTADEFAFRVERMFEKDQPATREAMERDRAIRDAFSAPDLKGVTFESSECRASTCRVKLTFDNLDYDRDILNRMLLNPETPFARGMGVLVPQREEQEDGQVSTTVLLYASSQESVD